MSTLKAICDGLSNNPLLDVPIRPLTGLQGSKFDVLYGGYSFLQWACKCERPDLVCVALQAGANPRLPDATNKKDAFRIAASQPNLTCLAILLNNAHPKKSFFTDYESYHPTIQNHVREAEEDPKKLLEKLLTELANESLTKTGKLYEQSVKQTFSIPPECVPREDVPKTRLKSKSLLDTSSARVWKIDNFLTVEQCNGLLKSVSTIGFKGISWEYDADYRSCERVVGYCPELAEFFWRKIRSSFDYRQMADLRPFGFNNEGVWMPVQVNSCFRFSRYKSGGHFEPHRDGAFASSSDSVSVLTLMVYLNGQPDENVGGETVFYEGDPDVVGKEVVREKPVTGKALIFNHDVWHSGQPVLTDDHAKYILRTDIMFQRIIKLKTPNLRTNVQFRSALTFADFDLPEYWAAEYFYRQSVIAQDAGSPSISTKLYIKALSMQAHRSSVIRPIHARTQEVEHSSTVARPVQVALLQVLVNSRLLTPTEVLTLSSVCLNFRGQIMESPVWQNLLPSALLESAQSHPLFSSALFPSMFLYFYMLKESKIVIVDAGSMYTKVKVIGRNPEDTKIPEENTGMEDAIKSRGSYSRPSENRIVSLLRSFVYNATRFDRDWDVIPSLYVPFSGHNWSVSEAYDRGIVGHEVVHYVSKSKNIPHTFMNGRGSPNGLGSLTPFNLERQVQPDYTQRFDAGYLAYTCSLIQIFTFITDKLYDRLQNVHLVIPIHLLLLPKEILPETMRGNDEIFYAWYRVLDTLNKKSGLVRQLSCVDSSVCACVDAGYSSGIVVMCGAFGAYIIVIRDHRPDPNQKPLFACNWLPLKTTDEHLKATKDATKRLASKLAVYMETYPDLKVIVTGGPALSITPGLQKALESERIIRSQDPIRAIVRGAKVMAQRSMLEVIPAAEATESFRNGGSGSNYFYWDLWDSF